jgi:dihydrofolate reductase
MRRSHFSMIASRPCAAHHLSLCLRSGVKFFVLQSTSRDAGFKSAHRRSDEACGAPSSLDGVIQHGGGRNEDGDFPYGEWTAPYRSPAGAEAVAEAQGKRFDFLLGRRTYHIWSSRWPKIKGGPFADAINAATKYVATHRPDGLEWGPVETLGADIVEGVRRVKSKGGPDLIVWGSSTLTPVLLDQGLVDDVVLIASTCPTTGQRNARCKPASGKRIAASDVRVGSTQEGRHT